MNVHLYGAVEILDTMLYLIHTIDVISPQISAMHITR